MISQNEIYRSACKYYHEKLQKLSLLENPKRIVLNTETTGLDASKDEILQLSIIDENAEILYNQYFKPEKVHSWHEAQAVNGISPEMVKGCPPIWKERNKIQSIIDVLNTITTTSEMIKHMTIWLTDVPLCITQVNTKTTLKTP